MPAWRNSAITGFFARLLPKYAVYPSRAMRGCLAQNPLTIVDVGAAMGVDERWAALGADTCRFVTFEPDKRSQDRQATGALVFGTALADEKGSRTLFLTSAPFASSLMRHNQSLLRRFAVWEWHQPAGEAEVAVERLDSCLKSRPDWRPDFIKTDAEGADLDVLKGAETALQSALGVQVEVAFVERHLGAPLFGEIDAFLRQRGFTLFQLAREHWLRRNGVFGPNSRPQLIWADAAYFRDLDAFRAMIAAESGQDAKEAILMKFVAVLLVYGCHDYAVEVVDHIAESGLVKVAVCDDLRSAILASSRGPGGFVLRGLLAAALASVIFLLALPFGSRARGAARRLVSQQSSALLHYLHRGSTRTGLARSCVSDPL